MLPGDPRRPYPTDFEMRSGFLGKISDLPISSVHTQISYSDALGPTRPPQVGKCAEHQNVRVGQPIFRNLKYILVFNYKYVTLLEISANQDCKGAFFCYDTWKQTYIPVCEMIRGVLKTCGWVRCTILTLADWKGFFTGILALLQCNCNALTRESNQNILEPHLCFWQIGHSFRSEVSSSLFSHWPIQMEK